MNRTRTSDISGSDNYSWFLNADAIGCRKLSARVLGAKGTIDNCVNFLMIATTKQRVTLYTPEVPMINIVKSEVKHLGCGLSIAVCHSVVKCIRLV
ncbi:hypothetical protein V6N12_007178 [Hibiscus sabdariffa]|uniref:Uncharacterized protein n=1 Tax=Hibiscus sabdariffa TaxID=183260 RepID=A0ABR2F124_9ROSI